MTALVYIGGYGRSGSTLLESLLTIRGDVLACGEIASCLYQVASKPCTCGKTSDECEVWGSFYKGQRLSSDWDHVSLVLALLEENCNRYAVLVDSSKTAWRALDAPFALRRKLGKRFTLLHVVRDPRGVCWSTVSEVFRRRLKHKGPAVRSLRYVARFFATALGWWVANLSCEVFAWRFRDQYIRIRYEDLSQSPKDVLDEIIKRVAPKATFKTSVNLGRNRHQLHGNEGRRRTFAIEDVRPDTRWKTEMRPSLRRLASITTWPLRRRYGY